MDAVLGDVPLFIVCILLSVRGGCDTGMPFEEMRGVKLRAELQALSNFADGNDGR